MFKVAFANDWTAHDGFDNLKSARPMETHEAQQAIDDLEPQVERLRAMYEQYFIGIEKLAPTVLQKNVERVIWELRRVRFQNSRQRFKFQQIVQRYNTYGQHWARVLRQIENGTYKRDIIKAAKRVGMDAVAAASGRDVIDREVLRALETSGAQPERRTYRIDDDRSVDTDEAPTPPGMETPRVPVAAPGVQARASTPSTGQIPYSLPTTTPSPSIAAWAASAQGAGSPLRWAQLAARAAPTGTLASSGAAPTMAHAPGGASLPSAEPRPAATYPGFEDPSTRGFGSIPVGSPRPPGVLPPPRLPPGTPGVVPAYAQTLRGHAPPEGLRGPLTAALGAPVDARAPHFAQAASTHGAPPAAPFPQRHPMDTLRSADPLAQPSPARASEAASRGLPPPRLPNVPPPQGPSPPRPPSPATHDDTQTRRLYAEYVDAKRRTGETTQGLSYEKVAQSIREQGEKLKSQHPTKRLEFEVVMKDGRALIRPVLR